MEQSGAQRPDSASPGVLRYILQTICALSFPSAIVMRDFHADTPAYSDAKMPAQNATAPSPGFPVELVGVGEVHAAFLAETAHAVVSKAAYGKSRSRSH